MREYLDKELLMSDIAKLKLEAYTLCISLESKTDLISGIYRVENLIKHKPADKVDNIVHGYWVEGVPYTCSVCGKPAPEENCNDLTYSCWASPYCPHCGAIMDQDSPSVHSLQ